MEWFAVGFAAMILCVVLANLIDERRKKSPPDELTVEDAERAVYDARTEDEYEAALENLLRINHRSLDDDR